MTCQSFVLKGRNQYLFFEETCFFVQKNCFFRSKKVFIYKNFKVLTAHVTYILY